MASRYFRTILCLLVLTSAARSQSDYPIRLIDLRQITVTDSFWLPRLQRNTSVTIPALFAKNAETGRVKNFEMAAARSGKFCTRYSFDDTDVYKTVEAASWSLMSTPDRALESSIDSLIDLIGRAQEPDGYLFTERTIDPVHTSRRIGPQRWINESLHSHELYNAGHLYEAAVAHYRATGKRTLLDIAIKNANLVDSVFGYGKREVAPGHQVIEMGLVKLYGVTGNIRYLNLARFFLEARGRKSYDPGWDRTTFSTGEYWQDHKPVRDQREAVGHAVRAMYLYAAMTDICALSGDTSYAAALEACWENVVSKKMYITGGLGAAGDGERFGGNYELPNRTAYTETCAAIGNVFWNLRMFQWTGETRFLDVIEHTLFNGILSGVGLDGKTFFYSNAVEVRDFFRHPDLETKRSEWFVCSCCPPNLARLLATLPSHAYAQKGESVYVNLFMSSRATMDIGKGRLRLKQTSGLPWNGRVLLEIEEAPPSPVKLHVRIPDWSTGAGLSDLYAPAGQTKRVWQLTVNGKAVIAEMKNGFAVIPGRFKRGDKIELNLPMEIQLMQSHAGLKTNAGKVAIQRGPLVYCIEAADHGGRASQFILDPSRVLETKYTEILGGIVAITGRLPAIVPGIDGLTVSTSEQSFFAIPYYAWANRSPGELTIWFPTNVGNVDLIPEVK